MVNEATYNYLKEYYAEAARKAYKESYGKNCKDKELQGYGKFDKQYGQYRVERLWELLDRVVCRGKEKLILADASGRFIYAYDGRKYERISDPLPFMKKLCNEIFFALEVNIKYRPAAAKIAAELLSSITSTTEFQYTPDRKWIAFANGVFSLRDFKLHPFSSTKVTDIVLDYDYLTESECNRLCRADGKRWDDFVGHKTNGVFPNTDTQNDIQLFCGALLLDRHEVKFEYMACIIGPGSNGKSVFVDAITGVFGRDYYATFTPSQLFREGSSSSFNVSDLEGKLVNVVGDLENKDFSGGCLKNYVSGAPIMAREPWGRKNRPVEPPLMICCANEFPETKDDSYGHHRRMRFFESTGKMWTEKDKDANLTAKLSTDVAKAYIFNWIVKGYKRIMQTPDYNIPWSEYSETVQERYKDNANSVRRWWHESQWEKPQDEAEGEWKPLSGLYDEYKAYCKQSGQNEMTNKALAAMLRSKGVKDKDGRVGVLFLVGRKKIENE